MKWKLGDIDEAPELSQDLEWMIQSGQVSRHLLLETLAQTYYAPIYKLTISLLGDQTASESVIKEIFTYLVLNLHRYRSQTRVELWVYQTAYQRCMRALRRERLWKTIEWWASSPGQFSDPLSIEPPTEFDRALWRRIDSLDDTLRIPLILRHGNGWEIPFISKVIGLEESRVAKRLRAGVTQLWDQDQASWKDTERMLQASLAARWGNLHPSDNHAFLKQMDLRTGRLSTLRRGMSTVKEMLWVGLAVIFVILVLWVGNRYILGDELLPLPLGSEGADAESGPSVNPTPPPGEFGTTPTPVHAADTESGQFNGNQPTPTPTGVFYYIEQGETLASIAETLGVRVDVLTSFNRLADDATLIPGQALVIPGSIPTARALRATPVTPVTSSRARPAPETSDDVFGLLIPEEFQFQTLWFSAEIITHDPSDLLLPSNTTRMQVWISPRQFLLIGGDAGGAPQEVGIGMRSRLYVANPGSNQPWFRRVNTRFSDPFIDPSLLYGLNILFGDIGYLTVSEFIVLGESRVAGRDTWVVSQLNPQGRRIGMLWLDKESGFVMRYFRLTEAEFSVGSNQHLPDVVVVNAVAFDVDFPQELFDTSLPWRGGFAADHTGRPGIPGGEDERVGFVYDLDDIPRLSEGHDLSQSRLSFRFPIGPDRVIPMAGTDIFADGYFLGRVNMGVPWDVSCQRSADGNVIVYGTLPREKGDIISLSIGPYYLDLRDKLVNRRILPSASRSGSDFAISPDNRLVALWACERNGDPCGVYLQDIQSLGWRRLIDVQDVVGDFVWSSDGQQLAMMTEGGEIWVVDTLDGDVLYTGEYDRINQAPPPGSPLAEWGVDFPPKSGGLELCINPPGVR